jgi:hypothetical protein
MNFVGQNVGEIRNDDPSGQQRWGFTDREAEISCV